MKLSPAAARKKEPTAWLMGFSQKRFVPDASAPEPDVPASSVLSPFELRVLKWKFPDIDTVMCRSAEEARWLVRTYLPHLGDEEAKGPQFLLRELGKRYFEAKKGGFPLNLSSDQEAFLAKMGGMLLSRSYPGSLSQYRQRIYMACIDLRLLTLAPIKKTMAKAGVHATPKLKAPKRYLTETAWRLRIDALKLESDWAIVQRLVSRVGIRRLKEPTKEQPGEKDELLTLALNWRAAWKLGPERFAFGSREERWEALKLAVVLPLRPHPDRPFYDQIKRFKKIVGLLAIPVWGRAPIQLDLLEGDLSHFDAFVGVEAAEEVVPLSHDGQLEIRYWDGSASQQELFVQEAPWMF